MTTKPKKTPAKSGGAYTPRKQVPVAARSEEEAMVNYAKLAVSPELAAYRVMNAADGKGPIGKELDVPSLMDCLRDQANAVNSGDLAQAEAMLMNQATALQNLFAKLTESAMNQTNAEHFKAMFQIALRSQSQCRQTLEALSAIKNPPVVYAKQANVTTGPQQINNGIPAPSRTQEIENPPNKQLEADHGEWMDTRTTGKAINADPAMETVGTILRAANG